jgi:hypothetical protein
VSLESVAQVFRRQMSLSGDQILLLFTWAP